VWRALPRGTRDCEEKSSEVKEKTKRAPRLLILLELLMLILTLTTSK
jgi:predicted nucleic acid-binding Zn ribbon protein